MTSAGGNIISENIPAMRTCPDVSGAPSPGQSQASDDGAPRSLSFEEIARANPVLEYAHCPIRPDPLREIALVAAGDIEEALLGLNTATFGPYQADWLSEIYADMLGIKHRLLRCGQYAPGKPDHHPWSPA